MNLLQIKKAVKQNKKVFWGNEGYEVKHWEDDQWVVFCNINDHAVGLISKSGKITHEEKDFYINK
jgi:hypothetical protein|tara:strand:+ start:353 stop:547 length:195 start_codon:yes stop_codon:yes gene_type:complete